MKGETGGERNVVIYKDKPIGNHIYGRTRRELSIDTVIRRIIVIKLRFPLFNLHTQNRGLFLLCGF